MSEEWKYTRQRVNLVNELRDKGITDSRVLEAIGRVPRHLFVERALRTRAYEDEALPIGLSQTISQPYTVAFMTALLNPQRGERILEIGTGSGYQAAVLCELGATVFSVERHKQLFERTHTLLRHLNYNVVTRHGDGTLGWQACAPFDGIIVTAGALDIPRPLLDQLRLPDGRLVIPVGDDQSQTMMRLIRRGPDDFERQEFSTFRFVPLIGDNGN